MVQKPLEVQLVSPVSNSERGWNQYSFPLFFKYHGCVHACVFMPCIHMLLNVFFCCTSLCFDHEQNIWFSFDFFFFLPFYSMWAWSDVGKGLDYILEMSNLSLSQITKLKGWINHGIKGPESIADHMYSMSLMALIADDRFSSLWKAELRKVKQFISWEDLCFSFFVCTFKKVNVCIYTLASCNSNL